MKTLEEIIRAHPPEERAKLLNACRNVARVDAGLFGAVLELVADVCCDVESERLLEERRITEAFVQLVGPMWADEDDLGGLT